MAPPRVSWARLCTGTAKASESGSPASPFGGRRRPGSSHMDPTRTGGSHTVSTTSTEPVGSAPAEAASESTMLGPVPLVPLGRPQVAAAARLAEHGLRHPVQLAGAGLRLGRELASVARGASLRAGACHLPGDVVGKGGMPSSVDPRPSRVGEPVGAPPGAVVFRNDALELLQSRPATPQVFPRPVASPPPEISRHYILDL